MDDHRDFIDSDEGYREIDWDSSLREPFFTHAVPCENCGEPCEETRPADWNPEINVGPCCAVEPHAIPNEPVCPILYALMLQARTVGEMMDACKAHRKCCAICNPHADEIKEAA